MATGRKKKKKKRVAEKGSDKQKHFFPSREQKGRARTKQKRLPPLLVVAKEVGVERFESS